MTETQLPVPVTERGRSTRARLLQCAEEVLGEVGFEQTSVGAITQRAGVAQGSFYTYFPSKHAVFIEVIRAAEKDLRRQVAAAANFAALARADRPAIERAGMEAAFQFFLARRAMFSIVREAQVVAPDVYEWWVRSFVGAYVDNFDRLTPDRPADVDIHVIACVVQGAFDMLALWYVHWGGALPPAHVIDQTFELLSSGLDGLLDRH